VLAREGNSGLAGQINDEQHGLFADALLRHVGVNPASPKVAGAKAALQASSADNGPRAAADGLLSAVGNRISISGPTMSNIDQLVNDMEGLPRIPPTSRPPRPPIFSTVAKVAAPYVGGLVLNKLGVPGAETIAEWLTAQRAHENWAALKAMLPHVVQSASTRATLATPAMRWWYGQRNLPLPPRIPPYGVVPPPWLGTAYPAATRASVIGGDQPAPPSQ
jgi:hypothetical protein